MQRHDAGDEGGGHLVAVGYQQRAVAAAVLRARIEADDPIALAER
nr:hypothetical protein GCM10020092_070150 [Actinoplanes digitatis]